MRRMKVMSWVLGAIALIASIALAVNWAAAYRGSLHANADLQRFRELAANWKENNEMSEAHEISKLRTDRLVEQAADLEVELARSTGRGLEAARMKQEIARANVRGQQLMVSLGAGANRYGEQVANAQQRVSAASSAAAIYSDAVARDERLALLVAGLWMAFGFAFALSEKKEA